MGHLSDKLGLAGALCAQFGPVRRVVWTCFECSPSLYSSFL